MILFGYLVAALAALEEVTGSDVSEEAGPIPALFPIPHACRDLSNW